MPKRRIALLAQISVGVRLPFDPVENFARPGLVVLGLDTNERTRKNDPETAAVVLILQVTMNTTIDHECVLDPPEGCPNRGVVRWQGPKLPEHKQDTTIDGILSEHSSDTLVTGNSETRRRRHWALSVNPRATAAQVVE